MPGGRPTKYTEKLADTILDRRSKGESIRRICRDPMMPDPSTIFKWIREREEFSKQYAQACEIDMEEQFDCLADIADEADPAYAQVAKLRIDTRKWAWSKRNPKKYGDKTQHELSGPDGGAIQVSFDPAFKDV